MWCFQRFIIHYLRSPLFSYLNALRQKCSKSHQNRSSQAHISIQMVRCGNQFIFLLTTPILFCLWSVTSCTDSSLYLDTYRQNQVDLLLVHSHSRGDLSYSSLYQNKHQECSGHLCGTYQWASLCQLWIESGFVPCQPVPHRSLYKALRSSSFLETWQKLTIYKTITYKLKI